MNSTRTNRDEIVLSGDDDETLFTDEERVPIQKVNHQFTQTSKLKGETREYTLFNNYHFHQKVVRKYGKKTKHRIDLTFLDPKPYRRLHIASGWLITSGILGVLGLLSVYVGWFRPDATPNSTLAISASVLISLSVISLLVGIYKCEDRMVFFSKYGRMPLLSLIKNNPNRRAFRDSVKLISRAIVSAQHAAGLERVHQLKKELKELRRLHNEQVLDEKSYERAKQRIFSDPAFSSQNGS